MSSIITRMLIRRRNDIYYMSFIIMLDVEAVWTHTKEIIRKTAMEVPGVRKEKIKKAYMYKMINLMRK